ncbi:unnamed protein product [Aphanomyces euteiches]
MTQNASRLMFAPKRPRADHAQGEAIRRKLRALGCPVEINARDLDGLIRSPSLRVQAFLHWFVDVLSPNASRMAHFSQDEQSMLLSIDIIADEDVLREKERMKDVDNEEAALLAEIAGLEQNLVQATHKHTVLQEHLAATEKQRASMQPIQTHVYSTKDASPLTTIDTILEQLEEGSNALDLAVLCPQSCISLTIQEDKILDAMQSRLAPYFKKSSPVKLGSILESTTHIHDVAWLSSFLPDESDDEDGDSKDWARAFDRLRAAYPAVEIELLHTRLYQAHNACIDETSYLNYTAKTAEEEMNMLLEDTVPQLLEAVLEARFASLVVGDYPNKYDRQKRHLQQLGEALKDLETQSARLQLIALVLEYEMATMITLRELIYAVLQDMQQQLQEVMDRLGTAVSPPRLQENPPPPNRPSSEVQRLRTMRSQLREEWKALGAAYAKANQMLKKALDDAPTMMLQLQQVSQLKDMAETQLTRAIHGIVAKQSDII